MDLIKLLSANLWTAIVLMLFLIIIVSIVLGIALEAYKVKSGSIQRMQELRNEELRLRLQMEQQKKGLSSAAPAADPVLPKEPSWEEQSQISYEMGYQQHH